MNSSRPALFPLVLSCIAGGLAPLSFSPVDLWPLALISVAALFALLQKNSSKQAAWTGWCYGLGFFGVGASWIFVSINVYGNAPPVLAGILTGLFVAGLALLFSFQCWLYQRFFHKYYPSISFAAVWVLFEWFRSWFLTGFPWLYLGYAHLDTPLAGIAPVFGVMGISFIVVLTACLLFQFSKVNKAKNKQNHYLKLTASLLVLWMLPALLKNIAWVTEKPDENIQVGLVQANIDQNRKFDRAYLNESLDLYERLSNQLWEGEIVIWPETALPVLYQQAGDLLDAYSRIASQNDSTLITGILSLNEGLVHNSITSLGAGAGLYHKQKMVPFGEYLPFAGVLESVLQLFELPMSNLSPGPSNQAMLSAGSLSLAPFICYEVVYPDFVRKNAIGADFLVTISNDTWFGASFGPLQHLQMAAMRALENGRYIVRATNNGVSAIINEKGQILSRTPQFKPAVLKGEVKVFSGRTPFSWWGSYPLLAFCVLFLLFRHKSEAKFSKTKRAINNSDES